MSLRLASHSIMKWKNRTYAWLPCICPRDQRIRKMNMLVTDELWMGNNPLETESRGQDLSSLRWASCSFSREVRSACPGPPSIYLQMNPAMLVMLRVIDPQSSSQLHHWVRIWTWASPVHYSNHNACTGCSGMGLFLNLFIKGVFQRSAVGLSSRTHFFQDENRKENVKTSVRSCQTRWSRYKLAGNIHRTMIPYMFAQK